MTGYCSNSPLRCDNARTMTILNETDNCCTKCGLPLVTAFDLKDSSRRIQQFLSAVLAIMALLLLVLLYVYYANIVS